ncbi:MAG TPA: FecR domain-containing protein, partial [Agitococcus sp.]|nr:FecR domain-containing protein [Agitococcus sp.]
MMRQTYPNLNAKGLLTAFVSCLLSGQVIADVAGRVNFVSGKVEAVSADGNRRNLVRGELVNSGERLETNSGRVQIRFTDGSFVSLQPNTVFGLDNYAFNKAQPNEGSLLFNFIRGSMRTVSGAIGKVNRGNYKVQTPVATIGIRGTSYAASQEPNGRLLLTVGKGIVNLQNDFGDSDINAGQTFQVETGKAPTTAPRGESVSARAKDPESKQQQKEESTGQNDNQAPNLADDNLVGFIQARDGIPRLSSFGSLLKGESGVQVYPNVQGFYSDVSSEGNANGRLLALTGTDFTGGNTAGKVILNTRNGIQSLNFSNVQQVGSLFLGAWTNGKASIVDPYIGTTGQLNLSALQFMPYVVGTTAEKNLGNHMTASYSLAGSLAKGLGTLTKLNIIIDLNLMPLVSVDMAATLANINYTATLNKSPLLDISFDKKFSGFNDLSLLAQSDD